MTGFAPSFPRPSDFLRPDMPHHQNYHCIVDYGFFDLWDEENRKIQKLNELYDEIGLDYKISPQEIAQQNLSRPILDIGDVTDGSTKSTNSKKSTKPKTTKKEKTEAPESPKQTPQIDLTDFIDDMPSLFTEKEEEIIRKSNERAESERQRRAKSDKEKREKRNEENRNRHKDWSKYYKGLRNQYLTPYYVASLLRRANIPYHKSEKGGAPSFMDRDMLICIICRFFERGKSVRALDRYFDELHRKGIIAIKPSATSVFRYTAKEEYTDILRMLVTMSGYPMVRCDPKLAIDSTGYRTTKYNEYYLDKHVHRVYEYKEKKKKGVERIKTNEEMELEYSRTREYYKLHIVVGTESHAIAFAKVTESVGVGTGDTSVFRELLPHIVKLLGGVIVTADGAYCDDENYNKCAKNGVLLISPFDKNARPENHENSPAWLRMYNFSKKMPEAFAKEYHVRNNSESVNFSMKKTLGEGLESRKAVTFINELYCKAILHNIRQLIIYNAMNDLDLTFDDDTDIDLYFDEDKRLTKHVIKNEKEGQWKGHGVDFWDKDELGGLEFEELKINNRNKRKKSPN